MRSGTSYFNGTIFKKTVLRYWPVWAAYSVIWLVALPLQGMMLLQMDAAGRTRQYMQNFALSTVPNMTQMSLVLAVGFGALCAMAVCSHLYNPRSANFFGSLPVRREGLFVTHYLAGLAFLIVPNAVICLLVALVEAAGGAAALPELLFWLGATCGECLFFYSMAVFCGMFTGHILALPAFYAIFNVLAYGVSAMVTGVCQKFYYGFSGFGEGVTELVRWLTPVWRLSSSIGVYREPYFNGSHGGVRYLYGTYGMELIAAYAAAAAALAVGSFLLYRARRLESAGDVVSVRCMRPVFKYGVSFCAGLAFGMLTTAFLGGQEPTLMVSILVWAVVGCFAAQMLLDKSFRVFSRWKGAAAMAGVFIALFLMVGFDLTGFETRVPTADQVDYVEFGGDSVCSLWDSGDYYAVEEDGAEFVNRVILLHQAAVDQRGSSPASGVGASMSMNLTYHLKDGSTLSRSYYPLWVDLRQADQEGTAAWAIQQMYDDRDLYWKIYGFEEAERRLNEEGYRLREITYEIDGEPGQPVRYYYAKEAQALYEAVKEDFRAGRVGVRRVEDHNDHVFARRNLQFQLSDEEDGYFWFEIRVQDTASSTLAALERLEAERAGAPRRRTGPGVPLLRQRRHPDFEQRRGDVLGHRVRGEGEYPAHRQRDIYKGQIKPTPPAMRAGGETFLVFLRWIWYNTIGKG